MGSLLDVQVVCDDPVHARRAIQKVFDEFQRVDALLSVYRDDSWVSRINASAGRDAVRVPEEVREIIAQAQTFAAETGGHFNILVEPLMRAYGFRGQTDFSDRAVGDAIEAASPRHLLIGSDGVGLAHPRAAIDLGGIGVGYAVDRSVGILRKEGISNALLNHSGDLYALGAGPEGAGWRVSIRDPEAPRGIATSIELKDAALSTSGNYESTASIHNETVGHILLTTTGRNPNHYLSLSVIAPKAVEADALSTGYFCSGKPAVGLRTIAVIRVEDGLRLVDRM